MGTPLPRAAGRLGRPLAALAVALLLGAILLAAVQRDVTAPVTAYAALLSGAFGGGPALAATLARATPILLTGLAAAVALAAGLFNIGAEGQMAVGGLAAACVGFGLAGLAAPLLLPLALLAGAAAGAAWALLPALLRVTRGAHEVITAILLAIVAANTTRYLATDPLKAPAGQAPQTPAVAAALPRLASGYEVHAGLVLALVAVVLVAVALRHTAWGYETRAAGQGPGRPKRRASRWPGCGYALFSCPARWRAWPARAWCWARSGAFRRTFTASATASTGWRWPCWRAGPPGACCRPRCCWARWARAPSRWSSPRTRRSRSSPWCRRS